MQRLSTQHWTTRALVALLLCGLLVQAQIVYSCQMMDVPPKDVSHQHMQHQDMHDHHKMSKPMQMKGPQQCCCDDSAPAKIAINTQTADSCCDIDTAWSLKSSETFNEVPALLKSQHGLDPPLPLLALIAAQLWPEPTLTTINLTWNFQQAPASPGTHTYLSTLRLRI